MAEEAFIQNDELYAPIEYLVVFLGGGYCWYEQIKTIDVEFPEYDLCDLCRNLSSVMDAATFNWDKDTGLSDKDNASLLGLSALIDSLSKFTNPSEFKLKYLLDFNAWKNYSNLTPIEAERQSEAIRALMQQTDSEFADNLTQIKDSADDKE